jgi:hypothetical protein
MDPVGVGVEVSNVVGEVGKVVGVVDDVGKVVGVVDDAGVCISEGSSLRPIQAMYLSRQSTLLGAGSTSMTSASLAPYPSRRERTYASFEGSSSMGSVLAGFEGAPEGSVWFEGCGSRVTDGWAISRAKTFRGTVIRPDAILASSSASSLCRRGT